MECVAKDNDTFIISCNENERGNLRWALELYMRWDGHVGEYGKEDIDIAHDMLMALSHPTGMSEEQE